MLINRLRNFIKNQGRKLSLTIGDIENLKEIGQGGNGLVFEGSLYGNEIVLKFLVNNQTGKSAKAKEQRFLAEFLNIQTLPSFKHIVKYISFEKIAISDEEGDVIFPTIIMDKYDCSLSNYDGEKDFFKLLDFLLNSVAYIHSQGIIHRDIKPENILCKNGEFSLCDFGIASYNPEMFELKAETKKGERLGNRLFSAPEQENGGITPHETMDIFALGQVLQWYCTGDIHRGTKRKTIADIIKREHYWDQFIEKCIANSPDDRFQSIDEIADFLTNGKEKAKKIDPFEILREFGDSLSASFPKNLGRLKLITDKKEINRFLENLSKKDFKGQLWWFNNTGSNNFTLQRIDEDTWLMGNHEIRVQAIWAYFDVSLYKDFVFWQLEPMPDFGVYENVSEYDEVALVDDLHYITRAEYDNNYAEIDGEVVSLSEHKVEVRVRNLVEDYMFITTQYHNLNQHKSERLATDLLDRMSVFSDLEDEIKELIYQMNAYKHPEVLMYL